MNCLTPNCKSTKISSRGLCLSCYNRLRKRVFRSKGKFTWEQLVKRGLAKPSDKNYITSEQRSKNIKYAKIRRFEDNRRAVQQEIRWTKDWLRTGMYYHGEPLTEQERQNCIEFLHHHGVAWPE